VLPPNRCLAGVAARFHLRLEGDQANAVSGEEGEKNRVRQKMTGMERNWTQVDVEAIKGRHASLTG
jgi:hypothetical protein